MPAAASLTVGLSDQHATTFTDPLFTATGIADARLIVPWDVVATGPSQADAWLAAARAAGIRPLVAFGRSSGSACPNTPCVEPTVAQYTAAVAAFLARYPWVTQITPWNEGNDPGQPTWHDPAMAARYTDAVTGLCPACTVVAGDVVDNGTQAGWLATFLATVVHKPAVWGLHNYIDVNYGHTTGTDSVLAAVPGQVWLTETAGLVKYTTSAGATTFPYDESRAATATQFAFSIAEAHPDRIGRIYLYQWKQGASSLSWDSGLVRADGSARPALAVVRSHLPAPAAATTAAAPAPVSAPAADAATALPAAPAPAPAGPARPLPLRGRLLSLAHGRVAVRLTCAAARARCSGVVALYGSARRPLRTAPFALRPRGSRTVALGRARAGVALSAVVRLRRPKVMLIAAGRRPAAP